VLPFDGGPSVKHPLIVRPSDPFAYSYEAPRWSPDASRVVIVRFIDAGIPQIAFIRTDGHMTGRAIARADNPDWSPDGRIVFDRDPSDAALGHPNLYVGKPAGPFRRLTRRGGTSGSWSPDGRRIAFIRNGGTYVVHSRGGPARRLVKPGSLVDTFGGPPTHAHGAYMPVWSPDGTQIAFMRSGYSQPLPKLYKVDMKTKRVQLIYSGIQPNDQVASLDWRARP
jgi:Tol biopolymer transport system component